MLSLKEMFLVAPVLLAILALFTFVSNSPSFLCNQATISSSFAPPKEQDRNITTKTNGVFVIKAAKANHAAKTLCSLTHFFNKHHQYPVRIFVDSVEVSNSDLQILESFAEGVDIRVIPDPHQRWTKLPMNLTPRQRQEVLDKCTDFETPERAKCTTLETPLGYVYMNYWNYAVMPYEDELQQYEYIISFDADAFLTQPIFHMDPFDLMRKNDLVGIFDIEAYQAGDISRGIQESAEAMFDLSERSNRFLGSRQWFDRNGTWSSKGDYKPSVWTHFWGGRRDFFDNARYRKFASLMTQYTYLYRVDEQPVIGAAWALLGSSDRIWYLPEKGIHLGVYHHGWVDNREMLRSSKDASHYEVNTLQSWHKFTEHYDRLLKWEDYLQLSGYGNGWDMCAKATTK